MSEDVNVSMPEVSERALLVWNGRIRLRVQVAGSGPEVVYLHPAAGMAWDPFLAALSTSYTIYAPECPGTSVGDPHAIHEVDELWDLILIHEEAIRRLALQTPVALIGQSFGGMLAAELAAHFPDRFSKVVLLAPVGLWREDAPIVATTWMAAPPERLPTLLFHDPNCEGARAMFALPEDPDKAVAAQASLVWAMGCTGKFLWPIPDRGLRKRLHRITAPTLILWGENDQLAPVVYADEFHQEIPNSRVEKVRDCGHVIQVERPATTLRLVREFLSPERELAEQAR